MSRPARPVAPLLPTTPAFLRLQAARRGDDGGLVFRGRGLTFGELADAADELGRWLARHGVGARTPVGVLAGNEPGLVAALFALWGLGAVVVPISTRSTALEAARLLTHARARLLLADAPRACVSRNGMKSRASRRSVADMCSRFRSNTAASQSQN